MFVIWHVKYKPKADGRYSIQWRHLTFLTSIARVGQCMFRQVPQLQFAKNNLQMGQYNMQRMSLMKGNFQTLIPLQLHIIYHTSPIS